MTTPERSTREIRRRRQQVAENEYHQARVLILIDSLAGKTGALDGLTKLAKLDFLLRYPVFLEKLASDLGSSALKLDESTMPTNLERQAVESRMMRYKYGPWDDRYYSIVGALIGRGLVESTEGRGRVTLRPTDGGRAIAGQLARSPEWTQTKARCDLLRRAFSRTSGNKLKSLIYDRLPEVVDRPHRTEI